MYFDALTLAAVADELRETIVGGRVQRVLLTGPLSIGLEIYAHGTRHHLIASADPTHARVHLVQARLTRGVAHDPPLLLLLRKYVLGGIVRAVEQPALERIILLSIVKRPESRNRNELPPPGMHTTTDPDALDADELMEENDLPAAIHGSAPPTDLLHCDLIIEPQDRRSNIILVDDNNLVLDSIKRVTPRMSSRVILPRHVYEVPPPQEKRDPRTATAAGIEALCGATGGDLARGLVTTYAGVSPQIAREAVFRALGRTAARCDEALPFYTIAARLRELFTAPAAPSIAGDRESPQAFAPYTLTHLPEGTPQPGISAALERFYTAREAVTGHSQRRVALQQQFAAARARLDRRRDQIAGELARAQALETLRWEGEMIFAFLHEVQPGQAELVVEGRTIALEPQRSAVEQAQERFKAYDKAKSAMAGLPERLAAAETQIAGLDELASLLALADGYDQIEQIAFEAEELGYLREHPDPTTARRKRRAPKVRPLHLVSVDGFDMFIGRSARQNEEVTFRIGRPEDLWVHVRIIHGSHLIVRSGGREVPETTLIQAAGLAAYFSQARAEAAVEVDVCRRSLVRKVPNGPPGLVTYRAERTLRVAPQAPGA
jgi:predicted ribosome quality control (RQC) complex YloA/Tae2 family protein